MSSDLIYLAVVDGEPRVDSRLVATELNVEHKATIQLVDKYSLQFQELGQLPFQMEVGERPQGGGWGIEYGFAEAIATALFPPEPPRLTRHKAA
jgi:hypothetical protein